ncbi:MAG: MMPL family transporter [Sulfurimonadaceae bacterium]|nr:MMPL family transporter [Sulfurimonadaceae bacterium]
MIYNRERFRNYSKWVISYRWYVTIATVLMIAAMVAGFEPKFSSNDASLWISGSKEQLRNEAESIDALHHLKLVYKLNGQQSFEEHIEVLRDLHKDIRTVEGVRDIRSILTLSRPFNNLGDEGSSLLEIEKLCDADPRQMRKTLKKYYELYRPYADADLQHFYIYVIADSQASLDHIRSFVDSAYISKKEATLSYLYTVGVIVVLTALLFGAVFRHIIPALLSVAVTMTTLLTTLFLAQNLFGIDRIHLAVTLLTLAIAQMDFIYFYYRWHVSQFKIDPHEAVHKALNRNTVPAFLTSVVTAAGLGSLVLIDIPILQQIGLFALLSAALGFLFSVTLLPALLSFFTIHNAIVPFARFSTYFAARELHYNRKLLVLFLAVVFAAGAFTASSFISKPPQIFDKKVQNDTVALALPFTELDAATVEHLEHFETSLKKEFEGVESVESVYGIMREMADLEGTEELDEQAIGRYLFFIELYGEADRTIKGDTALIHIWLKKGSERKNEIVNWTRAWSFEGQKVHLVDRDSLSYAAKTDDAVIMATSIMTALILIGVIVLMVTRKYQLLLISWIINAIPLVAFALLIIVFEIPLSVEILIAVTIMLGLASDATIHFSYKYMQSRHFYQKRIKALEKVFFYAGLPVIIGNVLLASIFFVLATMGVPTLQTIGIFAGGLILVSLAVDLFVMPVLLLFVDSNHALEE